MSTLTPFQFASCACVPNIGKAIFLAELGGGKTGHQSPPHAEYIYVKDLPDVGGLRAGRMNALRKEVEFAKSNGWDRLFVWWKDGAMFFAAIMKPIGSSMVQPPDVIEVYDLTTDLAPQFAEHRALHW